MQLLIHQEIDRALGVFSVGALFSCGQAGEDFDALVNGLYRVDMEFPFLHRLHDVLSQHQVTEVEMRDHHSLPSCQSLRPADIEESLDLLIDSTDGLDLSLLVDRSGNRDRLLEGQPRKCRENSVELGARSAVSFDPLVALFEDELLSKN
jgi:hypothetical protein